MGVEKLVFTSGVGPFGLDSSLVEQVNLFAVSGLFWVCCVWFFFD